MAETCILFVTAIYVALCTFPTRIAGTTSIISLEYKPMRPPYAGATGGNWVNYAGQRIPLGKPWPSRPEDYASFSGTTRETTPKNRFGMLHRTSIEPVEDSSTTTEILQKNSINYDVTDINLSTPIDKDDSNPDIFDRIENAGTNTDSSMDRDESIYISSVDQTLTTQSPKLQNRPSFFGPTGGNFIPQLVPPGKPWPSRPEVSQVNILTIVTPSLDDSINKTTITTLVPNDNGTEEIEVVIPPQLPVGNRPPFLGPTGGNFRPQLIPPGKPWPARPEDYNLTSQTPILDDRTDVTISNSTQSTIMEIEVPVPPGLEDYEGFNGTSQNSHVEGSFEDEKIIFPDDPILDRTIEVKSHIQNPDSNIFSVAFYLGDLNLRNTTIAEKPSLAVSVDLNSLNLKSSGQTNMNKKPESIKATEQFLNSEKVSSRGQSKNNYSVWINLKDLVGSSKKSAKINVSHVPKSTSEKSMKTKEDITAAKKHIPVKPKQNASNPFLSIFVNFDDFKKMRTVSSGNNTRD